MKRRAISILMMEILCVGDTEVQMSDVALIMDSRCLALKILSDGDLIWEKPFGELVLMLQSSIDKTILHAWNIRSLSDWLVNKGQNDAWILKIK